MSSNRRRQVLQMAFSSLFRDKKISNVYIQATGILVGRNASRTESFVEGYPVRARSKLSDLEEIPPVHQCE